jgi:hypothetical protein
MKILKQLTVLFAAMFMMPVYGASVIANVNGTPITDADVTARTKLMALQGKTSTDNRRVALQNIIDDSVKISYASNFNVVPDDKTVDKEFKKYKYMVNKKQIKFKDLKVNVKEILRSHQNYKLKRT